MSVTPEDERTRPVLDAKEGCCASCGAEFVPGAMTWVGGIHSCAAQYRGTFAASKREAEEKKKPVVHVHKDRSHAIVSIEVNGKAVADHTDRPWYMLQKICDALGVRMTTKTEDP